MRVPHVNVLVITLALGGGLALRAADETPKVPDAAEAEAAASRAKIKIAKLIGALSDEDFATREDAERVLKEAGQPALQPAKDALAATKDAEAKARLERIVRALILTTEKDPDVLAKAAREAALARRFDEAAPLYARAGELYRQAGGSEADEARRDALNAKGAQAAARAKRAEGRAKSSGANEGEQVVAAGGVQVRVMVAGGAGGRVQINGQEVEVQGAEGQDDW